MGTKWRRGRHGRRRSLRRGNDQGSCARERRHARRRHRQRLRAWPDLPRQPDANHRLSFQRPDVSLLRRHDLRHSQAVSRSASQSEIVELRQETNIMMQSSPLNARRAIIWVGRLVLGGIFVYAGFSKLLMPNTLLCPMFVLNFSISMNISSFAQQVESYKMITPTASQAVAHTLPFVDIVLGLLLLSASPLPIRAPPITPILPALLP